MSNLEKAFIGSPLRFKDLCLVHPPKVRDIVDTPLYGQYAQLLTMTQEEITDMALKQSQETGEEMQILTPFEMLLSSAHESAGTMQLVRQAFKFFTKEEIRIVPKSKFIIFASGIEKVTSLDDLKMLKEEDFFDFQNLIRESIGKKVVEYEDPDLDPRIAKIKAKARERERVKAKQNTTKGSPLVVSLTALCCMGIGITPLNIGDIPYAAALRLIRMNQVHEKYSTDLLMISGGADPKKVKPKYWITDLED